MCESTSHNHKLHLGKVFLQLEQSLGSVNISLAHWMFFESIFSCIWRLKTQRQIWHLLYLSPRVPQQPKRSQAKAWSQNFYLDVPCLWHGLHCMSMRYHCCSLVCTLLVCASAGSWGWRQFQETNLSNLIEGADVLSAALKSTSNVWFHNCFLVWDSFNVWTVLTRQSHWLSFIGGQIDISFHKYLLGTNALCLSASVLMEFTFWFSMNMPTFSTYVMNLKRELVSLANIPSKN